MSDKRRTWLVWEEEYPEDGSCPIRAKSAWAAKRKYLQMTGEQDTPLRAALLTPRILAERRKVRR